MRADFEAFRNLENVGNMKLFTVALALFGLSYQSLPKASALDVRQNNDPCAHGPLLSQIGGGNGGRKIGIVIDISASMTDYDRQDLRLAAAKELDAKLISQSSASGGKTPDLLTVVHFNSDASVIYPLGDPAAATSSFDHVEPTGGTFIGGGIKAATDELTKPGNDPTNNRTGIVVFTDGTDDPPGQVPDTIAEIQRAGSLGIRVSFGFLAIANDNQDPGILKAILHTGGIFEAFNDANSQENFILLVLRKGLTGIDTKGDGDQTPLLSGLTTSSLLSRTGSNTFVYSARQSETFNITVGTKDDLNLVVTLRDAQTHIDITSQAATIIAPGILKYTAKSSIDIEVVVTASNPSPDGVFSIELQSDISRSNNCKPVTNTTQPANTTQTPTQPFTGNACSLAGSWPLLMAQVSLLFVVAMGVL